VAEKKQKVKVVDESSPDQLEEKPRKQLVIEAHTRVKNGTIAHFATYTLDLEENWEAFEKLIARYAIERRKKRYKKQ
jgi:hypothetical protein